MYPPRGLISSRRLWRPKCGVWNVQHDDEPSGASGGNHNRLSPTEQYEIAYAPKKTFGELIQLSDYRIPLSGELPQNANSHSSLCDGDIGPDIQKLERVRILYDLATLWGIDLRMLIAFAAGVLM